MTACLTVLDNALFATVGLAATSPAALCPPFEKKPKPAPIDNTELVANFKALGGRIFHIPPAPVGPGQPKSRGVTFAFRFLKNRVEFATAVQHRNDDFSRKMGTKTAVTHFNNGQTVFLPLPNVKTVEGFLNALRELMKWGL